MYVVAFVVEHPVVEELRDVVAVSVAVDAAEQSGKLPDDELEDPGHVVVELLRIGARMHGDDGPRGFGRKIRQLRFEKFEVGNRFPQVELQSVGIETDEPHVAGREGEVEGSEDLLENLFARGQTVVVAKQNDIRHPEAVEYVALTFELDLHPEIRHVSRVEHEVDVVAVVERLHGIFRLVVPALRVGDDGEANGIPAGRCGLDAGDVLRVDAAFALDAGVVGVVVNLARCRREGKACEEKAGEGKTCGGSFAGPPFGCRAAAPADGASRGSRRRARRGGAVG